MRNKLVYLTMLTMVAGLAGCARGPLEQRVDHKYAENDGVKLHYAALGGKKDPLVVMLHGFPDFWYTWRQQMDPLADAGYRVVAPDLRGYNLSDKPAGVENYAMPLLIEDVAAIIRAEGRDKAVIVGHDWGGAIAWGFAMTRPEMTDRLIVLNLPHPRGLARELANNEDQARASQYARNFQREGAHLALKPEFLAGIVTKDPEIRPKYIEAFEQSDFEAMLNYYKANFPRPPYDAVEVPPIKTQMEVLIIHGLNDQVLLPAALNDTWNWTEKPLTIVTVPGAQHWVQHDAADLVTETMTGWLKRTSPPEQ